MVRDMENMSYRANIGRAKTGKGEPCVCDKEYQEVENRKK